MALVTENAAVLACVVGAITITVVRLKRDPGTATSAMLALIAHVDAKPPRIAPHRVPEPDDGIPHLDISRAAPVALAIAGRAHGVAAPDVSVDALAEVFRPAFAAAGPELFLLLSVLFPARRFLATNGCAADLGPHRLVDHAIFFCALEQPRAVRPVVAKGSPVVLAYQLWLTCCHPGLRHWSSVRPNTGDVESAGASLLAA